ncbi:3-hydroxyisobutyrate dehydrogenase [Phyllostomus discolor]|uniref:3-hydroxyisobutyrate dehydrogenase n=1 Tax=Phyllostomus discolor TaxID=89673 RepID=A0A834DM07_9CHIR|nr:3-hydroxyisobutyrate dehydrogenase [Phyllostomus discolor]
MAASVWLRGAASGLRYWSRRQWPAAANLEAVCSRSVASKTPVGFIGLGNMGNPMAKNLMKHGYPLVIYDVFPDACKEFHDAGEQEFPWRCHCSVPKVFHHFCMSFLVELGLIRFSFVFSSKTWNPSCCSCVVRLNMSG